MTDLNTLKGWFKTGLKPTQEQFAAWMDSFFHKGEKIPQSSIEGLDTTLTNKAEADQLKNKADLIDGKIPLAQMPFADDVLEFPAQGNFPAKGTAGKIYLDLAADRPFLWDAEAGTYKPAGGDDLRMAQIEQNLASEITNRTNADAGKVDKPASDGNWVLNKLGSVFSWVDASNFGKNVANTLLDTIANAGVNMKANWRIVTNNFSFFIEGLSDKSSDGTFDRMLVQNGAGQMAKSNGSGIMVSAMSAMNDAQKDAYRNASKKSNETYATATPRISNIFPFIAKKDGAIDIVVDGINMFVDVSKSVFKVVNTATGQEFSPIANSVQSVSIYPNIIFFKVDTSAMPLGDYKVLITNHLGLTNTTDTVTFALAANVNGIAIPPITWETAQAPDYVERDGTFAQDKEVVFLSPSAAGSDWQKSYKSSEILSATDAAKDWVIEYVMNNDGTYNPPNWGELCGICLSTMQPSQSTTMQAGVQAGSTDGSQSQVFQIKPTGSVTGGNNISSLLKVSIVKQGLLIKVSVLINGNMSLTDVFSLQQNYTTGISMYLWMRKHLNGASGKFSFKLNSIIIKS